MADHTPNGRSETPPAPSPDFHEFTPPTDEEWRAAAVASLKGLPFEKLITRTYEGIDLQPLYRREDAAEIGHQFTAPGKPPFVRGATAAGYLVTPWLIAQELPYATPQAFNQALRFDLERGQSAINLLPDDPTRAGLDPDQVEPVEVGASGLSLACLADLEEALAGVDLESVPLFLRAGAAALPLAALLIAHLRTQGQDPARLQGCIETDPLGVLAEEGLLPSGLEQAYDDMALLTRWAAAQAPKLETMAVHSDPYHESGATAVQELAFAVATGVAYLRALQERGLSVDAAARKMRFCFRVGGNFFMEMAKLRAARLLWSLVVEAFGGSPEAGAMHIHVRTANRNKSLLDPHANMLRVTTEALAGALGGADSMHTTPYDAVVQAPGTFSRRIARNVQLILQEECNLTRLVDPAGGSWYVETLTDRIARRAWALFQQVEEQGGMARALQEGWIQEQIAPIAEQRRVGLSTRRDVLVGVNQYANAADRLEEPAADDPDSLHAQRAARMAQVRARRNQDGTTGDPLSALATAAADQRLDLATQAATAGATLSELAHALRGPQSTTLRVDPVEVQRVAAPFEALRAVAQEYAQRTGAAPTIFLANMGTVGQYKARADFTRGFYSVGGFRLVDQGGFPAHDPEEAATDAAQAALDSGAGAVVICSSDDLYPAVAPTLTRRLKGARPDLVVILAGLPKEQVDALRDAGVDEFIHLRADCWALNRSLQQRMGVG